MGMFNKDGTVKVRPTYHAACVRLVERYNRRHDGKLTVDNCKRRIMYEKSFAQLEILRKRLGKEKLRK